LNWYKIMWRDYPSSLDEYHAAEVPDWCLIIHDKSGESYRPSGLQGDLLFVEDKDGETLAIPEYDMPYYRMKY